MLQISKKDPVSANGCEDDCGEKYALTLFLER
jgi:hypothetical protein